MMTNLFSSFDPSTNWNMSLNWTSSFLGLLIIPMTFWLIPSRLSMLWMKLLYILHKELKTINSKKGATILFISILSMFMMNNFIGLFPFIFTASSHLSMTLAMALPLWLTFMVYGWIYNTFHSLAHLAPTGTPIILMPFMVCIESISNIIRPLTLTIRLSANMIAGHLLLTLLGNAGTLLSSSIIMLLSVQMLMLTLESMVALIQAYVFAVLITLYSSEVN